jgi:hypothetical protein
VLLQLADSAACNRSHRPFLLTAVQGMQLRCLRVYLLWLLGSPVPMGSTLHLLLWATAEPSKAAANSTGADLPWLYQHLHTSAVPKLL